MTIPNLDQYLDETDNNTLKLEVLWDKHNSGLLCSKIFTLVDKYNLLADVKIISANSIELLISLAIRRCRRCGRRVLLKNSFLILSNEKSLTRKNCTKPSSSSTITVSTSMPFTMPMIPTSWNNYKFMPLILRISGDCR